MQSTFFVDFRMSECILYSVVRALRMIARTDVADKQTVWDNMSVLLDCIRFIWPCLTQEFCRTCGKHGDAVKAALFAVWRDVLGLHCGCDLSCASVGNNDFHLIVQMAIAEKNQPMVYLN